MSSQAVETSVDANGYVQGYVCDTTLGQSSLTQVAVPYYYDLQFPCSLDADTLQSSISDVLIRTLAADYRIMPDDGNEAEGCTDPPQQAAEGGTKAWVLGVMAAGDEFLDGEECAKLSPNVNSNGACCKLASGNMTVTVAGGYSQDEFFEFVSTQLDSTDLWSNTPFRTAYRGSTYELTPSEPSVPVVPSQASSTKFSEKNNKDFTVIGGVVCAALVVALVGVLVLLFRRRRDYLKNHRELQVGKEAAATADNDLEAHTYESGEGPNIEVLSDLQEKNVATRSPQPHPRPDDSSLASKSTTTTTTTPRQILHDLSLTDDSIMAPDAAAVGGAGGPLSDGSDTDTPSDSANMKGSSKKTSRFTFDLGSQWKSQVMSTYAGFGGRSSNVMVPYGPTSIAVVPPYEETSDSEADSWAQTDGTVGSLEERLEEITAEI